MEVAIIGAGVGGLTAALAIHRQGIDCRVRVYEGAREIRPLGVGINLLPHCGRELTELGLGDALRRVATAPIESAWITHPAQLNNTEPCGLTATRRNASTNPSSGSSRPRTGEHTSELPSRP